MGKGTWPNPWDQGLAADRPAASAVGVDAYYLASDTGTLSQSDGVSTWTTVYTFGGSAFTDLGWFDVTDYGAVHDNSTDDAAAIELALDACIDAGGGTVYFPAGIYLVSRAMQSTGTFNSQIRIKKVAVSSSANPISIRLLGAAPVVPTSGYGEPVAGSVIRSNWSDTISGHPAIFSAGLYGTLPGDAGESGIAIRFEELQIQYPDDPKLTGIQAHAAKSLSCHRVSLQPSVDAGSVSVPTHSNSVGIDMPLGLASQFPDSLYDVGISGMYTCLVPSEQANGTNIGFGNTVVGIAFSGQQGSPSFLRHANHFGKLLSVNTKTVLKFTSDERWVFIDMLNVEHDASPFATTYDIDDSSNYARGFVGLHTTDYSTGPDEPLINGASGLSYQVADKMRWQLADTVIVPDRSGDPTTTSAKGAFYAKSGTPYWRGPSSGTVYDLTAGSTLAYGSNATRVRAASAAGSSNAAARADHAHDGIATITSSASNTLGRGNFNIRGGTGVGVTATDSDGDGQFDTLTFSSFSGGGGGGGSTSVSTDPIWDAAGDLAVGTGSDTAVKLSKGAAGGALSIINGAVAWNSGTSNPGSAATGDRYWRTDLGYEIYYDGTRWLTVQESTLPISLQDGLQPSTANGQVGYAAIDNGTYDNLITRVVAVTLPTTTNTGAAFWTVALARQISATSVASFNTSADTVNVLTRHNSTPAALTGTTDTYLVATATKTGSPGNLYCFMTVYYRKVIT